MTLLEVLRRQRAALLERDDAALAALERAYEGIAQELDMRIDRLQERIEQALLEGLILRPSWLYQEERYQALLSQAQSVLSLFAHDAAEITVRQQQAAVVASGQDLAEHLTHLGLGASFNALPTGAVDTLVGFLADGSPITAHFARMPGVAVEGLQSTLLAGIAAGDGPRALAYQLRKAARLPLDSALRTARTEHLRAYNESSLERYRQNSDLVTGWQWMATLSARTCPYCLAMHGTLHALDEPFIGHVQCRCCPVPVTRSGPPISESGESWLAEQKPMVQERIMGTAAARAWRAGEVRLSDFVGTKDRGVWGEAGYVRSLKAAKRHRADSSRRAAS